MREPANHRFGFEAFLSALCEIKTRTIANFAKTFYYLNMGVNTKYKDSVFSFLFSDPDLLRELYIERVSGKKWYGGVRLCAA